jgi:hypothetical protein
MIRREQFLVGETPSIHPFYVPYSSLYPYHVSLPFPSLSSSDSASSSSFSSSSSSSLAFTELPPFRTIARKRHLQKSALVPKEESDDKQEQDATKIVLTEKERREQITQAKLRHSFVIVPVPEDGAPMHVTIYNLVLDQHYCVTAPSFQAWHYPTNDIKSPKLCDDFCSARHARVCAVPVNSSFRK